MNVLYLCNGCRECGAESRCYLNGGECNHTADESFAKTPKNERRFKMKTISVDDSIELALIELDSKDFLTL